MLAELHHRSIVHETIYGRDIKALQTLGLGEQEIAKREEIGKAKLVLRHPTFRRHRRRLRRSNDVIYAQNHGRCFYR